MAKIANCTILERPVFQGRPQYTQITAIKMYSLIEIRQNVQKQCPGLNTNSKCYWPHKTNLLVMQNFKLVLQFFFKDQQEKPLHGNHGQHLSLLILSSFTFGAILQGKLVYQECPQMFTVPVGPVEGFLYWPGDIFGNYQWLLFINFLGGEGLNRPLKQNMMLLWNR